MFEVEKWQVALEELKNAIRSHEEWYGVFIRALVCRLPGDHSDVADDADRRCGFGQWYHGDVPHELHEQARFVALRDAHHRMHQRAAALLRASAHQLSIAPSAYDDFAGAIDHFRREIHALEHEIEASIYGRDPLTGAEGRVGMVTKLREALELTKRQLGTCCIAVMDLDHFKETNDAHGHLVGDQVLVGSVRHLVEHLRPYDAVFRYGGDEFLISMPSTTLTAGQVVIERISRKLSAAPLSHDGDGKPILATASFGITLIDAGISIEESIGRADCAMYAAKTAGRNRVCVWDPSMTPHSGMHRTTAGGGATAELRTRAP